MRRSLIYVPWKKRELVAADLKKIYRAETGELARSRLEEFAEKWDDKYPPISKS